MKFTIGMLAMAAVFFQSCALFQPSRLDSWKYSDMAALPDVLRVEAVVETDSGLMIPGGEVERLLDALLVERGLKIPAHPEGLEKLDLKAVITERTVGGAFSGTNSISVELSFFLHSHTAPVLFARKAVVSGETVASSCFLQALLESALDEAVRGFGKPSPERATAK